MEKVEKKLLSCKRIVMTANDSGGYDNEEIDRIHLYSYHCRTFGLETMPYITQKHSCLYIQWYIVSCGKGRDVSLYYYLHCMNLLQTQATVWSAQGEGCDKCFVKVILGFNFSGVSQQDAYCRWRLFSWGARYHLQCYSAAGATARLQGGPPTLLWRLPVCAQRAGPQMHGLSNQVYEYAWFLQVRIISTWTVAERKLIYMFRSCCHLFIENHLMLFPDVIAVWWDSGF